MFRTTAVPPATSTAAEPRPASRKVRRLSLSFNP
jgi:hypothetical protein